MFKFKFFFGSMNEIYKKKKKERDVREAYIDYSLIDYLALIMCVCSECFSSEEPC